MTTRSEVRGKGAGGRDNVERTKKKNARMEKERGTDT